MALISNIGSLIEEALTDEPNDKDPTFNEETSPDDGEVKVLDLIALPNGAGKFNGIIV